MQPLIEYGAEFGGYGSRVLELEGEGPAVVCFHGYADSADTWRFLLADLARRDRRAVAVDLPGFGRADTLHDGPILPQLDRFARGVLEYALAESEEPPLVVGNSLGGLLGMRLAERAPDGVGGVVAIAPAGLDMARWFALIERDPVINRLLTLPLPVPAAVMSAAVGQLYRILAFADPGRVPPEAIATFSGHLARRAVAARVMRTGHRLLPELSSPFVLEQIRCPLLLVWGDRDRLVFRTGAERVLETVPGSRLELLEGYGHCPQIEAPERVSELVLSLGEASAAAI